MVARGRQHRPERCWTAEQSESARRAKSRTAFVYRTVEGSRSAPSISSGRAGRLGARRRGRCEWWPGADNIARSDVGPPSKVSRPEGRSPGRTSSIERSKAAVLPRRSRQDEPEGSVPGGEAGVNGGQGQTTSPGAMLDRRAKRVGPKGEVQDGLRLSNGRRQPFCPVDLVRTSRKARCQAERPV